MRHGDTTDSAKGSIFVEAAIVLPILMLLFSALVNISLLVADYLFLSQVAREITLYGATVPFMSETTGGATSCAIPAQPSDVSDCDTYVRDDSHVVDAALSECANLLTCFYGQQLIATRALHVATSPSVSLTFEKSNDSGLPADPPTLCTFGAEISASYKGIFSLYNNVTIKVSGLSGYVGSPYSC